MKKKHANKKVFSMFLAVMVFTLLPITSYAVIEPIQLTVENSTADNKSYDGTTTATANLGTVTGIAVGDEGDVTVTASASFADKEAGNDKEVIITYSLTGTKAERYTAPVNDTVHANISPKQLEVTGSTADEKTYDGAIDANANLGTVNGKVGEDDVTVTIASATFADKNAGNGKNVTITYSLSGNDAGNYTAPPASNTVADISKRSVTVTADDKSKSYGEEDPTLTATITNLVTGDSLNYTLNRDEGESVGNYVIHASEQGVNSNYTVTCVNGTFTITEPTEPTKPTEPTEPTEPADSTESEATPTPAPKANEVKKGDFVATQKTVNNVKIDGQSWYGYQFESVFEKKEAKAKDVTDYLDKCIARGKELITFTPSGLDTTSVIDLGTALSKVSDKEKVKGLDFSSVTINKNADLSNAFAGYTSLEIIDISNWRVYNGTFEKVGLASGAGQNIFYYNDLTNKEYIDKLEALGWVGKHENLDLSNWIDIDPSFIEWAGLVGKKTFTYNAATAQAYIDYLTALGWTGINENAV